MADQDVRALLLQIDANTQLLRSNLAAADLAVAKFQGDTQRHLNSVDSRFELLGNKIGTGLRGAFGIATSAAAGFIAVAGGVGLVALAKRGLDYASSLGEVSQQLGVTTRDLQVYRYAAGQVGISQEVMDKGLQKLTQTMGKAEAGAKAPIAAFNALGISVASLKGQTAGEVIPRIADGLAKLRGPAQRAAVEIALFGRAGQQLDTLLAGGSGQINALADAAEHLGIVLSDEQIQRADETADKLREVKEILEAQIAGVVSDNARAITDFAVALEKAAESVGKFLSSHPEIAGAALGAFVGGRFGLPGAGIGAAGGYIAGDKFGQTLADNRTDLPFRGEQLRAAREELKTRQDAATNGGFFSNLFRVRRSGSPGSGPTMESARAEVARQQSLYDKAVAAAKKQKASANAPAGDQDVPQFLASGGVARGPRGPSAQQLAEREASRKRAAVSQQARADDQLASLQSDLTASAQDRLQIELDRVAAAGKARDDEIAYAVKSGRLTKEEGDALTLTTDQVTALAKRRLLLQEQVRHEQENTDSILSGIQDREELLRAQSSLAVTTEQRRKIELELLALQQREARVRLAEIVSSSDPRVSAEAKARAQATLDALPPIETAQRASVERSNAGPGGRLLQDLDPEKINDQIEQIKVDGLKGLEDGLVGIMDGTKSVSAAFKDMAQSIISDLARIAIQQMIIKPLATSLFGGLGFADGGKVPGFASGGAISGPGGPRSDSILAAVSNGEFIVNAEATKRNLALLQAINDNKVPRFANGGLVSPSLAMPRLPDMRGMGGGAQGGGGPAVHNHFHITGAVMTQDLIDQMNAIGQAAVVGGAGMAQARMTRAAGRRLGS